MQTCLKFWVQLICPRLSTIHRPRSDCLSVLLKMKLTIHFLSNSPRLLKIWSSNTTKLNPPLLHPSSAIFQSLTSSLSNREKCYRSNLKWPTLSSRGSLYSTLSLRLLIDSSRKSKVLMQTRHTQSAMVVLLLKKVCSKNLRWSRHKRSQKVKCKMRTFLQSTISLN